MAFSCSGVHPSHQYKSAARTVPEKHRQAAKAIAGSRPIQNLLVPMPMAYNALPARLQQRSNSGAQKSNRRDPKH
jgi:hypothetical protein